MPRHKVNEPLVTPQAGEGGLRNRSSRVFAGQTMSSYEVLPRSRYVARGPGYSAVDDGCEYSPSCLQCPLPVCKYDDPVGALRWAVLNRVGGCVQLAFDFDIGGLDGEVRKTEKVLFVNR